MMVRNRLVLALLLLGATFQLTGCVGMMYQGEIDSAREEGNPVLVIKSEPRRPDSAGGVDVEIEYFNLGDEPLKYVRFEVTPYNAVGDRQVSTIGRGKSTTTLRDSGPIETQGGMPEGGRWENIWYNHSIACIEIEKIRITSMDDSEETFEGNDVSKLLADSLKNEC